MLARTSPPTAHIALWGDACDSRCRRHGSSSVLRRHPQLLAPAPVADDRTMFAVRTAPSVGGISLEPFTV
jgi:hypothetical protein